MNTIEKLRARQKECLERMEEINQLTITETRDMTEEEQAESEALEAEDNAIETKIEGIQEKQEKAAELAAGLLEHAGEKRKWGRFTFLIFVLLIPSPLCGRGLG